MRVVETLVLQRGLGEVGGKHLGFLAGPRGKGEEGGCEQRGCEH